MKQLILSAAIAAIILLPDGLSIDVQPNGDVILTVVSSKPWTLWWSGDVKSWVPIRSGTPDPASTDYLRINDKGWALWAFRSFYRLTTTEPNQTAVTK